jgi:hypothetical protein
MARCAKLSSPSQSPITPTKIPFRIDPLTPTALFEKVSLFTSIASVTLVHPEQTLTIPVVQAIAKCRLFQDNLPLAAAPYRVQSSVTLSHFRAFVSALKGKDVNITSANVRGLQRLCEEFGFTEFSAKLSGFRPSRERIAALEEKAEQHDGANAQLSTGIGRLAGEVSALRSASAVVQQLSVLRAQIAAPSVPNRPPAPQRPAVSSRSSFNSRIISYFPAIFAGFRRKRFEILWRGSRDGFRAQGFHRRCDGRANTLTVILDTEGNIFGGFTPVEWELGEQRRYKADNSVKSFLFTLKNPHNIPARRFALKAEEGQWAIMCDSKYGPWFYYGIRVNDNCHANAKNYACLGENYTNDTALDGHIVLSGSDHFQVKEIEVFEIRD